MGYRPGACNAELNTNNGEVAGLIAKGKLHAPIQATFDVSEIKEAVALAASGGSGKVLIVPRN